MSAAAPRVSIGLPIFNGAEFVERSVQSILDQTYADWELIVSDNGSTDDSVRIIEELAAGDPRVRILRSDQNRGAAWNYNNAFAHATGEFFRWHADDDWFEPDLIADLVAALDANPDAVLAHSYTRFVDDAGDTTNMYEDDLGADLGAPRQRLPRVIKRLTFCNAVFGLVRRDELAKTALIAPFPGSDVPLLYELAVVGQFAVVPTFDYVRRPGNSIKKNPSNKALAEWFSPERSGARLPGLHLGWATLAAIWRSDHSVLERGRTALAFLRAWPVDYLRKSRRRKRRREAVVADAAHTETPNAGSLV